MGKAVELVCDAGLDKEQCTPNGGSSLPEPGEQ